MTLRGDRPTVLLSIELMSRELDSKLVMASALAGKGCRVVVGHYETVVGCGRASERIVWQGKNLFSEQGKRHLADTLISRNSPLMFLQDEGAMHPVKTWTDNVLQKHDVDHIRKRPFSRVCLWGERQRAVFAARAAGDRDVAVVTGSPRFDLCLPRFGWASRTEGAQLDRPYILVCTRFSSVAHSLGLAEPFRRKLNPRIWPEGLDAKEIADLWFMEWQRDVRDLADFMVMLRALAIANPERTVIVRPHPSESLDFYKQALSLLKNVLVVREGSALGWIRSADLVVHSNCTTGVEAVLAGRRVLNYLPARMGREETDVEVAREAGVTAGSIPEALDRAAELLTTKVTATQWSERAKSMLHNLNRESIPLLVAETLDVLKETRLDSSNVVVPLRQSSTPLNKGTAGLADAEYIRSKRGPLQREYVETLVDGCRTNGIGSARVSHLSAEYAVIEPAN